RSSRRSSTLASPPPAPYTTLFRSTGLANIVTGVLFLVAMFFTPLYEVVPVEAAAPALVIVGALMIAQIKQIDLTNFAVALPAFLDRKSTRLNSSHVSISYAVFCLK